MKLVILAGGRGKRMGSLAESVPKPMIPLMGKPILEHQLELAKRYDLNDVIVLTGYRGNAIKEHFKDGKHWGLNIQYVSDEIPLGTAGAVRCIAPNLTEDFVLFYGDTIMDIDLHALIRFHRKKGGIATLVVHPNDHPHDSDLLEMNEECGVTAFYSKPHKKGAYYKNLVNAALYVLAPEIFKYIEKDRPSDFGKDVFPNLLYEGQPVYAYNTTEYIKDVGTVERLKEVEGDCHTGKIQKRNKLNSQKAVFIDRDGVINAGAERLDSAAQFKLLPGVQEALRTINKSDYLSVVVTNQPLIAKGFASEYQVQEVHNYMEQLLGKERAYVDRIYLCPHHPERGHPGEREEYKIVCDCRKPATGMVNRAVNEMNIDVARSFIVGDRTVDIMTGINAGLQTVLVRTGFGGEDQKFDCSPDYIFDDLREAAQFIACEYERLMERMKACLPAAIFKGKRNATIAVGGLSRSGKSTFSAVACKYLEKVGKKVKTLKLDNWLLAANQRKPGMNVHERYQYDNLERDIKMLLEGCAIRVNRYDPKTRLIQKNMDEFFLADGEVLLIDGVVSLDHRYIRHIADVKFFTYVDEDLRKSRFYKFYRYKGLSEKEIDHLFNCRIADEVSMINQSRKYADHIVDMGFSV